MTYLPDVNVWIGLAVAEHKHGSIAREWFETVDHSVVFCRITQMGFLRVLTNRSALGPDTFSPLRAWNAFDAFLSDSRISRIGEPSDLEDEWREATAHLREGTNWWTDSYLAAFAAASDFTLVTFDVQLASRKGVRTLLLK